MTKKIAVISDVHGNLSALEAVLAYLKEQSCDEIIHTGDVVDIGPKSAECLALLIKNNVFCLMGNHDRDFVLNNVDHKHLSHVSQQHKQHVFETLDGFRDTVAAFPMFTTRKCGGQTILFEHYCRMKRIQSNGYVFCPIEHNPTAEVFDRMYDGCAADAVFFGHKHEPCDIVGKRLYVDVGSVGCHPQPTANGIIITYDDTTWSYCRFSIPYDLQATRSLMTDGTLPDGEYLYQFYFLHKNPPRTF